MIQINAGILLIIVNICRKYYRTGGGALYACKKIFSGDVCDVWFQGTGKYVIIVDIMFMVLVKVCSWVLIIHGVTHIS